MTKNSLQDFVERLHDNLPDFQSAMIESKLTAYRTESEWLKLFADYLGIENPITESGYYDPQPSDDDWP